MKYNINESIYTKEYIDEILDRGEFTASDRAIIIKYSTDDKNIKELLTDLHRNYGETKLLLENYGDYILNDNEFCNQLVELYDFGSNIITKLKDFYHLTQEDILNLEEEMGFREKTLKY